MLSQPSRREGGGCQRKTATPQPESQRERGNEGKQGRAAGHGESVFSGNWLPPGEQGELAEHSLLRSGPWDD